jgi:rhodanese-related sulfurtransferase
MHPTKSLCEVMASMGFTNLKNMSGGIGRWPFEVV